MPVTRVLVFGRFPNPTFDYYFAARLAAPGMPKFELIDVREFDPAIEASGAFVIIVRYASFAVTRWIKKNRAVLSGVAIFVDDDIAAAITAPQATLRYRYRLLSYSILPLRALNGLFDEFWVSTNTLIQRLSYANPRLLEPAPEIENLRPLWPGHPSEDPCAILIAYHATAIHFEEHEFLIPIVTSVLEARPSVRFEVVASGKTADVWLELGCERITVKAPLPWGRYLRSQDKRIDIMVVPVAPSRLNDCRAETKRIDIARVGAAALLSECPAFTPAAEGEILLPYKQSDWVHSLIELIDNKQARQAAAAATRRRVEAIAQKALLGIPAISSRSTESNSH